MPLTIKKSALIQDKVAQNLQNRVQTAAQPKEEECQTTSVHQEIDGRTATQYSVKIIQNGDMTSSN